MKRKQSPLKIQYMKERRRVLSAFRRVSREGFQLKEPPPIPKKITSGSIRRLKQITPASLRKGAIEFVNYETGEIMKPKEAIALHKQEVKQRRLLRKQNVSRETFTQKLDIAMSLDEQYQNIIDDFEEHIRGYLTAGTPHLEEAYYIAKYWLDTRISEWGKGAVAKALEVGYKRGNWTSIKDAYKHEILNRDLREMASILEMPENEKDALTNTFFEEEYEF